MAVATALAIIGLASAGISAVQQHKAGTAAKKAGEQQREAAESQAELADYNAAVAELQADDAIARGDEEEQRYRTQIRGVIGAQRAAIAAGNVDVSFGSAVEVQADAAVLGELDALQIKTNARREAWGYKVQAEDLRQRGAIARKEGVYLEAAGRQQAKQANVAAVGTLIGGGTTYLQAKYGFGTGKGR
jgi:hypothetical protein